jgi:hypothetical protein
MIDRWNEGNAPNVRSARASGAGRTSVWFLKSQSSPALIQAVSGTQAGGNAFNVSQAATLFPYNGEIRYGVFSGVRGTIGFWLNQVRRSASRTYMWFGEGWIRDGYLSSSSSILGRPFVDAQTPVSTASIKYRLRDPLMA